MTARGGPQILYKEFSILKMACLVPFLRNVYDLHTALTLYERHDENMSIYFVIHTALTMFSFVRHLNKYVRYNVYLACSVMHVLIPVITLRHRTNRFFLYVN